MPNFQIACPVIASISISYGRALAGAPVPAKARA